MTYDQWKTTNPRDYEPEEEEVSEVDFLWGELGKAQDAYAKAAYRIRKLEAAMKNVCDELEEDFDTVDGGDGQPAPNKAMRLASELKESIYGPGGF